MEPEESVGWHLMAFKGTPLLNKPITVLLKRETQNMGAGQNRTKHAKVHTVKTTKQHNWHRTTVIPPVAMRGNSQSLLQDKIKSNEHLDSTF